MGISFKNSLLQIVLIMALIGVVAAFVMTRVTPIFVEDSIFEKELHLSFLKDELANKKVVYVRNVLNVQRKVGEVEAMKGISDLEKDEKRQLVIEKYDKSELKSEMKNLKEEIANYEIVCN